MAQSRMLVAPVTQESPECLMHAVGERHSAKQLYVAQSVRTVDFCTRLLVSAQYAWQSGADMQP